MTVDNKASLIPSLAPFEMSASPGQELGEMSKTLAAKMRRRRAQAVYWYLVGYSLFTAAVIVLQGFRYKGFRLNETALSIMIGSTAVSAISLVAIVLKGLFPIHAKKSSNR